MTGEKKQRSDPAVVGNCRMYQREVDVDMLNAVKSLLADVLSVSPSSEQKCCKGKCQFHNEPFSVFLF